MSRALTVAWDGAIVGTLRLDAHGQMRFAYSPSWLEDASRPPISLSLPKRPERFSQRECRPFFAGLLPEAAQRDAVARALGVSTQNDYGLLEALGGDVAGALTLWPEGENQPTSVETGAAHVLEDVKLAALIDALPMRPLLAGSEGLRLSLAGAQSKLPVVLVGGRIALPAPGQATTHILKPPVDRFPSTTENEAFVMKLGAAVGLAVAPVEARVTDGRSYLLVTRYDRQLDETSRVRRLHQEDFCQALGIAPEQKYAAEGGPTFKASFELLRRATARPAVATLALLDAAIFNLAVGNADAHGKNFSILLDDGGATLAPLYDLLCTAVYEDLTPRMAMRIAKCATLDEIAGQRDPWGAFASEIGMGASYVRRRVASLSNAIRAKASVIGRETALPGLEAGALSRFAAVVTARAERVARTV